MHLIKKFIAWLRSLFSKKKSAPKPVSNITISTE